MSSVQMRLMLKYLGELALERRCGRMEWICLDLVVLFARYCYDAGNVPKPGRYRHNQPYLMETSLEMGRYPHFRQFRIS